jgi:hypothetical protein
MAQTISEETRTQRLAAFDAEIKAIDADLYTLLTVDGDSNGEEESVLNELDQQFIAAGLADDLGTMSVNTFTENEADAALVGNFIKKKVEKIIKELRFLARRYPNCTNGIKALGLAVAAYAGRKWPTALRYAVQATKAFKDCIN